MEMLSLSRTPMYKLLRSGRIRSVGQGRARRIPASALLEYIDLLEREAAKKRAAAGSPRRSRPNRAEAADKENRSEQEDR
jgi:excisionase family DNA binding protein